MWWNRFSNQSVWLTPDDLVVIFACYVVGCFTAGYYLVNLRTGEDIRTKGSGTVGARNVGRALGPVGFIITFLLDFLKGALAVWLTRHFHLGPWGTVFAILALVIGHIWPAQLRFRGGKGIAPSLGALIVYDPFLVFGMTAFFLVAWMWLRRFTLSGIMAFSAAPLLIFAGEPPMVKVVGISILAGLILIAHRKNLREEIERVWARTDIDKHESHLHTP
jgi:glycerol-3-phosphate acyltransferase PlsY